MRFSVFTTLTVTAALFVVSGPARAASTSATSAIADIGFLTGTWKSGRGVVADTHETSTGSSLITLEANGAALLRRDHTDLFDSSGKSTGGFDQIMLVYPEGGTLHADYTDGTHIIHYVSAAVVPNRSVVFTSAAQSNAPTYRLRYDAPTADELDIHFEFAAPGSADFHPIATGSLTRAK